jgi:predicted nucleic acid-binding protein
MYVIDTSVVSALHRNYYRSRFVTLWMLFDEMVANGGFTSTREALRELEDLGGISYEWAQKNSDLFTIPDAREGAFVAKIYAVAHFQANMEKQKLLRGGRNADPFLIARAAVTGSTVLTMEQFKPHAAKIPNICQHFSVPCVDLENFMEMEDWTF